MSEINWFGIVALSFTLLLFVLLAFLRKKNVDFSLLILLGLAMGIAVGIIFRGNLEYVEPIGKIYVKIITSVVAPVIIFSILSSITSLGSVNKLKTIGLRSIFWLILSTFIAIILSLGAGLLLGVGKNATIIINNADTTLQDKLVPFTQVIIDFFPSNIVKDIQNNSIIPIILYSLLIAVAYVLISNKNETKVLPFKNFIEATKEIFFKAVEFIVELTPYAVVGLIAVAVSKATDAKSSIIPMIVVLAATYLVCAIHTFLVNGILIFTVAKLNPFKFFKKIAAAQVTAFTSQSSVGTLPITINNLTKKVGVSDEVASFVAPLGTTIGMPGCSEVWPVLLSVFAINALNLNYSIGQYFTLVILALVVSLGSAGVPGTATITATAVFVAAGLPVSVIILLLPISTIADMARTATNVTAAAVSATIIAKEEDQLSFAIYNGLKSYEQIEIEKQATQV